MSADVDSTGSGHRRKIRVFVALAIVATLAASLLSADPAAGVAPPSIGRWTHDDGAYSTASALVRVNDDKVRDVVVAAGHQSITVTVPFGNPNVLLDAAKHVAGLQRSGARLVALDGATGEELWAVRWSPGELAPVDGTPGEDSYTRLDGLQVGQLDGRGGRDVFVARTLYSMHGDVFRAEVRHEMYDAATGVLRWADTTTLPEGSADVGFYEPVRLPGRPGGVVTMTTSDGADFRAVIRLIDFRRTGTRTLHTLRLPVNTPAAAKAAPIRGGARLLISQHRGNSFDDPAGRLRAVDVRLTSPVTAHQAWSVPGAAAITTGNGHTLTVVGGRHRKVVVPRGDGLAVRSLRTGKELWRNDLNASHTVIGAVATTHLNRDGQRDLLVSPTLGSTLYPGDFTTEIIALDGATGKQLWQRIEPLGKLGLSVLRTGDVDRDGRRELVVAGLAQDGFAFIGQHNHDPGFVGIYDLRTGKRRCHIPTDRLPRQVHVTDVDGVAGREIIASTVGGATTAISPDHVGCQGW